MINTRQMKIFVVAFICLSILLYVLLPFQKQEGLSLGAYLESAQDESKKLIENSEVFQEQITEETFIYIDVKGAVNNPNVYIFNEGDRIKDAIESAGGFREDAAENYINLAQILEDQMLLYVPNVTEIEMQQSDGLQYTMPSLDAHDDGLININTADEVQLMTLPNIGPSKAKAIIEYRDKVGSFQRISDIMEVSGIGIKTFEQLESLIEVR